MYVHVCFCLCVEMEYWSQLHIRIQIREAVFVCHVCVVTVVSSCARTGQLRRSRDSRPANRVSTPLSVPLRVQLRPYVCISMCVHTTFIWYV